MLSFRSPFDNSIPQASSVSSLDLLASTGTVGTDDRPQASPILTSSPLTGADPPLTWYTLNSFIPIFKLLGPKFVLDQNAYYIHGLVDDSDLAILRHYSSMVTEFILTDSDVKNVKPNIAPATFVYISQLLEPNSALLPSLSRLRIIHANTYLAYLHLLHTPSLRTLEVSNVLDYRHPTFFSFLTTLVHKAPLLEDIILGPGRFPMKSLQAILKFTHLHQLELRDVASKLDFTFFQDVGNLPNLESFILDARSCEYIARIPEEPSKTPPTEQIMFGSLTPKPSSDIDGDEHSGDAKSRSSCPSSPIFRSYEDEDKKVNHPLQPIYEQIPGDINSSIPNVGGFYWLKKFHFVGGLPLIQDIIPYIASNTLEDISITNIHLPLPDLKQKFETEAENMRQAENIRQAEAEKRRRIIEEEKQRKIKAMETLIRSQDLAPKLRDRRIALKRQQILEEVESQWEKEKPQYQGIEEQRRAERVQKSTQAVFDLCAASYISVLQTVSSRWSAGLKMVEFNQLGLSAQSLSILPALPKQVYGTLFCHPKIEILGFRGWKLDSVDDFLSSLKTSGPQNLKQLRLPIDCSDSAVSLSSLLDIAEACPMLESLHCCISMLVPIPEYSVPASKTLFHGLQTLSVASNPTSPWDFNQLLLVARHLNLMFPHLRTIDNVEGPNGEQWVRIHDLVKMFQTIRKDDMYRSSGAY